MKPTQIDARPILDSLMRDVQRLTQEIERARARVTLIETAAVNRLRRCVDSACECGGNGTCAACRVWQGFTETSDNEKKGSTPT